MEKQISQDKNTQVPSPVMTFSQRILQIIDEKLSLREEIEFVPLSELRKGKFVNISAQKMVQ